MRHITQSFRLELIRALVTSFEGKKVEVASRPSAAAGAPEWSIWITPGMADAQVTAAKAKLEDLWRVRHITASLKRQRATRFAEVGVERRAAHRLRVLEDGGVLCGGQERFIDSKRIRIGFLQ